MPGRWRLAALGAALACILSCGESGAVRVEPGVSLELARARSAALSEVRYRLRFDIPEDPAALIPARADISFDLAAPVADLQLDFRGPVPAEGRQAVGSVRANDAAVDFRHANEHILVPAAALRAGRNRIEIDFLAGPGSLNRNPDYLYTLFVPDRARTAFPLFDQPDIKARYELTLELPAGWQALANAPLAGVTTAEGRSEFRFQRSDLISSYLFSFVAGRFQSITREVNGRSMTMLHRETDEEKLARNIDAVFALHGESLDWMEYYTGIPYPYQKFDFALIPSFQYGGMEHVGAIQYRDSRLLLDESPSDRELLQRAQLIAHETAHMWFGNLVTMRWFDDVWTKEVFANFLADKIVNPAFPDIDHELNFLVSHYTRAYAVDRSEGPNPIRQQLPNLREAGQMYGAIIYHKAPIMMRQLERLLGEETLREGMREYLKRFSHANASWPELIEILDARTAIDLGQWSEVWVNSPGRPRFELVAADGGAVALRQVDDAGRGRVWPQRFSVLALEQAVSTSLLFNGPETPLSLPGSARPGAGALFNADGLGYGLFPWDGTALEAWADLEPVARGSALVNGWENLLDGGVVDAEAHLDLLLDVVAMESDQLLLDLALDQLDFTWLSLLADSRREARSRELEKRLWQALEAQAEDSGTRLLFKAWSRLATSSGALQRLRAIWSGELPVQGLTLGEEDLIELAEILAIRLPEESDAIVRRQMARTDNHDRRRRLAFITPALAAEPAKRDAFFASLQEERNRQTETWVVDALAFLHHPSRLEHSRRYLLPSLELLEEIQVTGDIFFPSAWLLATFRYHHSPAAVRVVRDFLAERPAYNAQLRMKILQAADPMFRASRIRAAGAGGP